MLYLIGIGFGKKDINLNSLETAKKCDKLYLENYTSKGCGAKDFERIFGKKIEKLDRDNVESDFLVKESKEKNIGLLVYGDCLFATTHVSLILDAKKEDVDVEIVHNNSVFNYLGDIGLSIYNYGKIGSITFDFKVDTPYNILKDNLKINAHTLFLLDLDVKNNKYLSGNDGLKYLFDKGMKDRLVVGCCALGTKEKVIKVGMAKELLNYKFDKYPQCLIIPSDKLHFIEEEALNNFK